MQPFFKHNKTINKLKAPETQRFHKTFERQTVIKTIGRAKVSGSFDYPTRNIVQHYTAKAT